VDKVNIFAPASVGNAGACYDIMGYALDYLGDFVTLERVERTDENVIWDGVDGPFAGGLIEVPYMENCAWLVCNHIFRNYFDHSASDFSLRLKLHKHMPVGSGLGSSAASSAAAAAAVIELLGLQMGDAQITDSLKVGESAASGTGHLDNVVPSFFGGFHLILGGNLDEYAFRHRTEFTRIDGCTSLVSVVLYPAISINTRFSRQAVRDRVAEIYLKSPKVTADDILSVIKLESIKAAAMVKAVTTNNVQLVGEIMNQNQFLESARSKFIPYFNRVKSAALKAGAYGCTIAGSGPSVVAITDNRKAASIRDAMAKAFNELMPKWLISPIGQQGVRLVDSIEKFTKGASMYHNFY